MHYDMAGKRKEGRKEGRARKKERKVKKKRKTQKQRYTLPFFSQANCHLGVRCGSCFLSFKTLVMIISEIVLGPTDFFIYLGETENLYETQQLKG